MNKIRITSSVLINLFLCASLSFGIQFSHKHISPFLTLTLVHGDRDALMTHAEAREFCLNLTSTSGNESVTAGNTPVQSPINNKPFFRIKSIRSDLVSIHTPSMVHEIMSWVLPLEKRQFWIGGQLRKARQAFEDRDTHLIQRWTDGTSANYRFLDLSSAAVERMPDDEVYCISVDYTSGKWGAHNCDEKMYFVCETVKLPEIELGTQPKPASATTTTSGPNS
ncbi:unnamed protein product [Echinostoma caproni]|uniref:C-type lectin domain-containing protein n=1 Tax=Echinostoma caproni TaxID=27848 RepID=A0A183B2M1_9TREM|nr:unnamed protein product [Echinostoma caproni]